MDKLEQLKNRIAELEKWKAQREKQQIVYPLDIVSRKIFELPLLSPTGNTVSPLGLASAPFFTIQVMVDGVEHWLAAAGKY